MIAPELLADHTVQRQFFSRHVKAIVVERRSKAGVSALGLGGLPGGGEGQIPGFPSKNARRENRRKFLRRNGQRGDGETHPEY
jgi:hypothetical protein